MILTLDKHSARYVFSSAEDVEHNLEAIDIQQNAIKFCDALGCRYTPVYTRLPKESRFGPLGIVDVGSFKLRIEKEVDPALPARFVERADRTEHTCIPTINSLKAVRAAIGIRRVATEGDLFAVRRLYEQYAASLSIDLGFQDFDRELATLPGDYGPPRGALFLAYAEGSAVGCIGLRRFSDSFGELKRLYVMPAFRGRGLARSLVAAAIAAARHMGYTTVVLDTLASM